MRILHVITDLDQGGAEMALSGLLKEMRGKGIDQEIICLSGPGIVGDRLLLDGFTVHYLHMRRAAFSLSAYIESIRIIRAYSPSLIQTWMYHADFFVSLLQLWIPKIPIFWGLHNSTLSAHSTPATRGILRLLCRFSQFIPKAVIACSQDAIHVHTAAGYAPEKMRFVPNGFDMTKYCHNNDQRNAVRSEFSVPAEGPFIGNISRFDQQKDHATLIKAWGLLAVNFPKARFLLAGKDLTPENELLGKWLQSAGIADRTVLLGIRDDVPSLLNALDLFVLSSNSGEAFPLVIGEAMSTGVLCAATDIGDTSFLIGESGMICPANSPAALCEICKELLTLPEKEKAVRREKGRERIQTSFSIKSMMEGYLAVYREFGID